MSFFHFCNCLNIKIKTTENKTISDEFKKLASSWKGLNVDCLEFFRTAVGKYKAQEVTIYTEENNLVQKLTLNNWIIHRCLNCDLFVYAVNNTDEYLLNGNLLHDESKLIEMQSSDKYSLPFKIILKQNFGMGTSYGGHDIRYKQLYMKLENFIANETENAEREIRQFTEQKLAELNYKREVGAKDYSMLVNLINSITDQQNVMVDCGNNSTNTFTNINNNNLTNNNSGTINTTGLTDNVVSSSSDIVADTPPITPESSTPMSIENIYISPSSNAASSTTNNEGSQAESNNKSSIKKQIPQQQPQNANTKKIKEMSAKHSKLIHQQTTQSTKTYDFDEMFDMDSDGLTTSNRKATQPIGMSNRGGQSVKFAADYDDCSSDQDESMDRNDGVHIPRHGNKNGITIAKSAPIPMAPMPGRVDSDLEDEPENNIDIAASIKALARSVHGDTVFGDLPSRPRFTTQI